MTRFRNKPVPRRIDAGLITSWMKCCNERHSAQCLPLPIQDRPAHAAIPAWVIDVQEARIVNGSSCARYVALSYRWTASKCLNLQRENLHDFQKVGFLCQAGVIDQLLQETFELVNEIGERYLWVDRLCIVQDDNTHKRNQVDIMDEIYSGAYLTIIAAATVGLYGQGSALLRREQDRNNKKSLHILDQEGKGSHEYDGVETRQFRNTIHENVAQGSIEANYGELMLSEWYTRGWTFQEQVLSKRAIIFLDDRIFWDCGVSVWDNANLHPSIDDSSSSFMNEPYEARFSEMGRQIGSNPWPDFRLYIESVCQYNGRNLKYPQDALPAFSGILNRLGKSFEGGFIRGLPALFLDAALLWQPLHEAKRRRAIVEEEDIGNTRSLPSWSWCGWQCWIDPLSLMPGLSCYERDKPVVKSWELHNLVQWSVLSEDMTEEHGVCEPALLEQYKALEFDSPTSLPAGWVRNDPSSMKTSDNAYFTHNSDTRNRFSHPLPIPSHPSELADQDRWRFLACNTSTAILKANTTFTSLWDGRQYEASFKMSVFDLSHFTYFAHRSNVCSVICLATSQDGESKYAGVLRVVDDTYVSPDQELELLAISTGSANWTDADAMLEEQIVKNGVYYHGCTPIRFGQNLSREQVRAKRTSAWGVFNQYSAGGGGSSRRKVEIEQRGDRYQFYNVLWIERIDGIAYRKGAGRVLRDVWEAHCSEPGRVVLG